MNRQKVATIIIDVFLDDIPVAFGTTKGLRFDVTLDKGEMNSSASDFFNLQGLGLSATGEAVACYVRKVYPYFFEGGNKCRIKPRRSKDSRRQAKR